MATQAEIKSFIILLGGLAVNECNRRIKNGEGFILPSVCIAQSALETGWGTADLMKKANAFFGIKAGGSWTGKSFSANTQEVYNGKSYNIRANFRAYDNLADSVKDYYNLLLGASRYSKAVSYFPDRVLSASQTVREIANAGYATDEFYYSKVYDKITYRDLTTWDAQIDGITVVEDASTRYTDIDIIGENFTPGELYINNGREVLVRENSKAWSYQWSYAIPMRNGTYTINIRPDHKLKVIALTGETFEEFNVGNTWTNTKPYDKVAFTLYHVDGLEISQDEFILTLMTEGYDFINVVLTNPNYGIVKRTPLANFIKI